ncbi:winged helix-turn-helix transcriptional regulator [uncultured Devosia sp.]|uniref:winged helix-turn-helix transcriptional regulator n=1 Tax=uncultured Devosia sp. TaxID=211434 RepID=UPI0035CC12D2
MSSIAYDPAAPDELLVVKPGKWTLIVITRLRRDKRRFNELRRDITGISQKTLTSTLRELERDGFVSRTLFPTIPPRVDYELTELGHHFLDLADTWRQFAAQHRASVEAARVRFDHAGEGAVIRLTSSD